MASESTQASAQPVPYLLSFAVGSGSLLQPLNSSMIAVALVSIGRSLHLTSGTSWLISALYLATAVGAPTAGRLADLFGPRRVFLTGLVVVGLGGIGGAFATSLGWLIAARVLLGLGTATQYPAAMAIIRGYALRARADASGALSVLGVCAQVSVAFGPTLGGFLTGFLGWQAVFAVNLPLVLISGAWVWRVTDPEADRRTVRPDSVVSRLDLIGLALTAASLTTLMLFLLSLAGRVQWWWLVAVPLALVTIWWERRTATPFLDIDMIAGNRAMAATFGRQLLISMAFYSIFYAVPQWLETVRAYDPETAGLFIIPVAGVGVVSTVAATRLIRRVSITAALLVGNAALTLGGLLIVFTLRAGTPVAVVIGVAALLGIPNGFNNMGNQNELYAVSSADQIGAASGLLRTSQYVGANLSAAMLEILFAGPVSDAGLHRVGVGIAVVSGLLLATSLLRLRRRREGAPRGRCATAPGS